MFLLRKTSYCLNVVLFLFYLYRNMKDLRLYLRLPRFLDILSYFIVSFISVTIRFKHAKFRTLERILGHGEKNKDTLLTKRVNECTQCDCKA
jgi:hypothetical protein